MHHILYLYLSLIPTLLRVCGDQCDDHEEDVLVQQMEWTLRAVSSCQHLYHETTKGQWKPRKEGKKMMKMKESTQCPQ